MVPARRTYVVDGLQNALPFGAVVFDTIFDTRSMERDRMVGAAGELFVSNYL
jgi:hypothetical protein